MSEINRNELLTYLNQLLDVARIRDYLPNGLQVEGCANVKRLVTGVTASLDLIDAALDFQSDVILVHHGYFWKGEDPRIVGTKKRRLQILLKHDINLLTYHLPLDLHPVWGNNVQLGQYLGLVVEARFGESEVGFLGRTDFICKDIGELAAHIENRLGRTPLLIGNVEQTLGKVAWCTGAAQGYFGDAINAGASVYLSGEISESTVHLARESGVAYLACGHHASERYGVKALGEHLAKHFGIEHRFIDIDNPV